MSPRRGGIVLPSLAAGVLLALSLPPWGWWPLAIAGAALLVWRLRAQRLRVRVLAGWVAGLGCFGPGLWWARSFNWYGAVVLAVAEAASMGVAAALVPPERGRLPAAVGAFTLLEALRLRWPFGGLPLGGVFLGQAGGPLLGTARLGGPLLLTGLVWAAGAAVGTGAGVVAALGRGVPGHDRILRSRARGALALAAVVVALPLVAAHAPAGGRAVRSIGVAAVQGGGRRGVSEDQVDPVRVFAAQVSATRSLARRVRAGGSRPALIVWPEDVVALDGTSPSPRVGATPRAGELGVVAGLARASGATLAAGVTIPVSARTFRNEIVVWGPSGRIVAIFEKVHRVPFGEYVPGRAFFAHFASLSGVPLDAVPGRGSGLVRTPAAPLGILVSFEVFFADRSRSSVRAGAEVLVVPTNTSSYATDQVPGQEVAADRVQAVESGRDLVQAAPTGYSTIVRPDGRVSARSALGSAAVLEGTIELRTGITLYVRVGDLPVLVAAAVTLLSGIALAGAQRHRRRAGAHTLADGSPPELPVPPPALADRDPS